MNASLIQWPPLLPPSQQEGWTLTVEVMEGYFVNLRLEGVTLTEQHLIAALKAGWAQGRRFEARRG